MSSTEAFFISEANIISEEGFRAISKAHWPKLSLLSILPQNSIINLSYKKAKQLKGIHFNPKF
jgi:hypothetical protein